MESLAASVRASQPIKVGVAGEARRELFLEWSKRRLPTADIARVQKIDNRYRETAAKVGLLDPKPVTAKGLVQTSTKLNLLKSGPAKSAACPTSWAAAW